LIEIFRELGATLEVTRLEYWTGRSLLCLGRFAEGEQLLRGVLEKARSLQDRRLFGEALENIAYAQSSSGNLAEARAYIAEALDVWHSLGAERKASNAEVILAEAEFRAGYVERAIGLVTTALLRLRQIDHGRVMPAIINLAAYLIACDRWGEAQAVACEALGLAQETQRTVYRAWALQHVAAVAALSANAESDLAKLATSARLIGYVDARIAVLASPREYTEQQEYDRVRTVLRDALGSEEMERLMTAGAGMMEDQAVTLALSI
jgi:tetratricopeptide (TPR) repeat protein